MNKNVVRGLFAVTGLAVSASSLLAQAPSSAQVWDIRFVADSSGAFAAGPSATAVGITIFARVGIMANSSTSGTNNFGVSRVGGAGSATSGFRVTFTDALSAGLGLSQGTIGMGATGQAFPDTNGNPIAGHFSAHRGSFNPVVGPAFMGSNTDPGNGLYFNPATGPVIAANMVGSRSFNFGSDGSGPLGVCATALDANPANLVGDLVGVYRMVFFPREDLSPQGVRNITVTVRGQSARYGHTLNGTNLSTAQRTIGDIDFSFQVPTPGAAAVLGLGVLALGRRRRA